MATFNYLLMSCMGSGVGQNGGNAEGTGSPWYVIVIYIAVFVAFIYFIMVRPQRKQKQKQQDTMNAMEPGDSVLTTSGFYGTIVSVTADTVIVEFGNNKNCRIPMAKQAISQVEKANAATAQAAASAQPSSRKKFFERAEKAEAEAETAVNTAEEKVSEAAEAVEEKAAEVVEKAEDAVK